MDMENAKPRVGNREGKKLEDLFDMLQLKDGKWTQVRIMPYAGAAVGQHWIDIVGSKTKKEVRIPKMCVSFNGETEEHNPKIKCPYCGVDDKFNPFYVCNVIVRSLQEDAPRKNRLTSAEKKSGFKDPDSESWTPIKVMRIPSSLMRKIQGLKDLNKDRKTKKTYSVLNAEFGADINVMYNSKASGTDKYQLQLADKVALNEEELSLLRYELDAEAIAKALGRETPKEAAAEFKRMELVGADKFDDDDKGSDDDSDDGDSEDLGKRSSKSRSKSKSSSSRSRKTSDDDSDDAGSDGDNSSDDAGSDDGDSSDDKPAAKSKSRSSSKSKSRSSKDSDDDNSDDAGSDSDSDGDTGSDDNSDDAGSDSDGDAGSDDGSSDDKPAAKSKRSSSRSSKKDDSDDGDSGDEPPAKSSKSRSSSRSKKQESDDDSEDGASDDKPAAKSSRSSRSSKSSSGSSSKSSSSRSSRKSKDSSSDDIPF